MMPVENNFEISQDTSITKRKHISVRTGICPSCHSQDKKLSLTITPKGCYLARCAYSGITQQLTSESVGESFKSKCFAACSVCAKAAINAIKAADTHLNGEVGWLSEKHIFKKSKATILQSPLYCGEGKTLVCFYYFKFKI